MYRKILVAYNGSPESRLAIQECIHLAPGAQTDVHLLAVATLSPMVLAGEYAAALPIAADEEAERAATEKVLETGRRMLAEAGLRVTAHLEVGDPADVIEEMVNRLGIDLVIVGHSRHKPFALRWWRGAMDSLLVERVRCSVLVAADPTKTAE